MPFKSRAQQKYLWMKHPDVAEEFQKHTPKKKKLPEHVDEKKAGVLDTVAKFTASPGFINAGSGVTRFANKLGLPQLRNLVTSRALQAGPELAAQGGREALGMIGAGAIGAGTLGTLGLGHRLLGSKEGAQLGTPFTDGFLAYCLEHDLPGDKVADMLEKGAAADGKVGEECKALIERLIAK